MAYAELAGLPAVTGLYTSILCLVGYAVFGPSKVLVLGPDSSLGPMIAATILPLAGADGDPAQAVLLASMLAVMTGALMVTAGAFRFGFIADLLSKPTILGYMNGLALTIVVGQLPKLLGFSTDAEGFIEQLQALFRGIADGLVVPAAAAVGVGSVVLIIVLKRAAPKIPAVLVAVIASIAAVAVFDLVDAGVKVVGSLPQGLPSFQVPLVPVADLLPLALGAVGISLVALTDTISTASSFAERRGEDIDGDKEMIGIGASNIAAGLFQGFPVSASGSRSAVAEQVGAKSQLTGLVGAAVIAVMLVALPSLFADLPQATLAAVVITAAVTLADIPATRRLLQQRRTDFVLSVIAFLGVVLFGVLLGIVLAVVLSVANVFRRVWMPHDAILGRVPGVRGFHDVARHPGIEVLPGTVILRFDAPLIFANARTFRDRVRQLSDTLPANGWIIVAAEPITDVDTTACDMLQDLAELLATRQQAIVLAEVKSGPLAKLHRFGLDRTFAADRIFPTIGAAADAYRESSGSDWVPLSPSERPGEGGFAQ
jgi:high affinity sulfate transporter 1